MKGILNELNTVYLKPPLTEWFGRSEAEGGKGEAKTQVESEGLTRIVILFILYNLIQEMKCYKHIISLHMYSY